MAVRLARFFYNFPGEDFKKACSPEFWWMINSKWMFFNTFNPKNPASVHYIPVGKKRFIYDEKLKDFVFDEDKSYLQLDQNMQVYFEDIPEKVETHNVSTKYDINSFDLSKLMAAEDDKPYEK